MALGAISVAAFLISNSFNSTPREKKVIGKIERTGEQTFHLTDLGAREHRFQLSDPVTVFLNEKEIPFESVENGRQAEVRFVKRKGQLFATGIEVFPTHSDFEADAGADREVKS